MRWIFWSCCLAATGIFILSSCDRTESDWLKAKQANTIEAYKNFLTKYHQGQHVDEAMKAAEDLDWTTAQQANTEDGYRTFLANHKESRFSSQAFEQLAKLEYDEVSKTNSLTEYKEYVLEFGGTSCGKQMQDRIDGISEATNLIEHTRILTTSVHGQCGSEYCPVYGSQNKLLSARFDWTILFTIPNDETVWNFTSSPPAVLSDQKRVILSSINTDMIMSFGASPVVGDKNRVILSPTTRIDWSVKFMSRNKEAVWNFAAISPVQRNSDWWALSTSDGFTVFYNAQNNLALPEFSDSFSLEGDIIEIAGRLPDQLSSTDFYRLWRILTFLSVDKSLNTNNSGTATDTLNVIRKTVSNGN